MSDPVDILTVRSPCCDAPQRIVVELPLEINSERWYDCPECGDRIRVDLGSDD